MRFEPIWQQQQRDVTIWIGQFTGYRVLAFGKEQVLYAPIEIQVRQVSVSPPVWTAKAFPGADEECASGVTAEDCMADVAALFTQCLVPWRAFVPTAYGRFEQVQPTLVPPPEKKAG
jgi:hypothetical protein